MPTQSDVANVLVIAMLSYSMALSMRTGLFSIAPAAFASLGAYCFGILTASHGWSAGTAYVVSVVGAVVVAALLAVPLGRIKGVYTSIATLAMVVVVAGLATTFHITGGSLGLVGIPFADVRGLQGATLVVIVAVFYWLDHSTVGRRLAAVSSDPALAGSLGISVARARRWSLTGSAAIAALAGGFYAQTMNFIQPSDFSFTLAISVAATTVLGGATHWSGPLVGALLLGFLDFELRPYVGWGTLCTGLTLLAVMLIEPAGIGGLVRRVLRYARAGAVAS